jgi:carboxyvinyl-carboxyphosphonate phosphorylmutase
MNYTERRKRLRNIFAGNQCHSPASVYDPLSARVAESVGYEIGMLAGSVASNTTIAAPDLIVLTMSEFAEQIRRITRACTLSLVVDADHGYGNALNVMRTACPRVLDRKKAERS